MRVPAVGLPGHLQDSVNWMMRRCRSLTCVCVSVHIITGLAVWYFELLSCDMLIPCAVTQRRASRVWVSFHQLRSCCGSAAGVVVHLCACRYCTKLVLDQLVSASRQHSMMCMYSGRLPPVSPACNPTAKRYLDSVLAHNAASALPKRLYAPFCLYLSGQIHPCTADSCGRRLWWGGINRLTGSGSYAH